MVNELFLKFNEKLMIFVVRYFIIKKFKFKY